MAKRATEEGSARDRVIDVAARLFTERGYTGTSMREIADALGVKQPALYYHAPEGKHQLFLMVLTQIMQRHRTGLNAMLAAAAPDLRTQLYQVVTWLTHEQPLNLARLAQTDMPALPEATADAVDELIWESLYLPIAQIFLDAQARGEIPQRHDPHMLAGAAIALIDSVRAYNVPAEYTGPPDVFGRQMIDLLLDGVRWRAHGEEA